MQTISEQNQRYVINNKNKPQVRRAKESVLERHAQIESLVIRCTCRGDETLAGDFAAAIIKLVINQTDQWSSSHGQTDESASHLLTSAC